MNELPADPDTLLTQADFQKVLQCGDGVFKDMWEGGELPEPTMYVGKKPRWRAEVVRCWIKIGGIVRRGGDGSEASAKSPEKAGKATKRPELPHDQE